MSLSMRRILDVLAQHPGATTEVVASYVGEPTRRVAPVIGRMRSRRLVVADGGGVVRLATRTVRGRHP